MITKTFAGVRVQLPGIYWTTKVSMSKWLPIGVKREMHYADAFRLDKFLEVLQNLDMIGKADMTTDFRKPNDNELYYVITIWENLNVN